MHGSASDRGRRVLGQWQQAGRHGRVYHSSAERRLWPLLWQRGAVLGGEAMNNAINRRLRLADADGITADAVERERIAQSHRDYRGEAGNQWATYDGPTTPWSHTVTRAIASQYRV